MTSEVPGFLHGLRLIAALVLHVAFALFVFRDAQRRDRLLFDVPPWLWALVVLVSGVVGVAFYWLANCARFVRGQTLFIDEEEDEPPGSPSAKELG